MDWFYIFGLAIIFLVFWWGARDGVKAAQEEKENKIQEEEEDNE